MVSSTPRPHFTPGKEPVPIVQEAGWVPGPAWTGGKSRPHRNSNPDCPARSSVAIPTELPGPHTNHRSVTNYRGRSCVAYSKVSYVGLLLSKLLRFSLSPRSEI